jgi:hypothetical protein
MATRIPIKSECFLLMVNKLWLLKMQQLILGTGTAIWCVTEPDCGMNEF